ncbi:hypothetical protein HOD30_00040 [Candidatus Peregrinibacteria bacterium]|jgi:hypothetical protein|nr:hypothetical protein [Candidatus Peregrinibacteria bacterium]MBT4632391.1 hypothetical protein [Candidatus Peregrinibacteria bacterium]MBT5823595.1 hypothetical protein [Candidatus Peregrinibacteria bacterium]
MKGYRKNSKALCKEIPRSSQNPLLSEEAFFKLCLRRFHNIGRSKDNFVKLLDFYNDEQLFSPVFIHEKQSYYSTFQVFNLFILEEFREKSLSLNSELQCGDWKQMLKANKEHLREENIEFSKLLKLLIAIQDYYLPEVMSDGRVGELRDYGTLILGGTFMCSKKRVVLSALQRYRNTAITAGKFKPKESLDSINLSVEEVVKWTKKVALILKGLNPLAHWHLVLKYVDFEKKQKLRGDALVAQDLHGIVDILFLFLKDLGEDLSKKGVRDAYDWFDLSKRAKTSHLPIWKERMYGEEIFTAPYKMLEFLTNEFNINPKPRAIIFTEGQEWKAISKLFAFMGYSPKLLGIEFRALGSDKLKYEKWIQFIEYMHEKQTYMFFLIDDENNARQARNKFKTKKNRINEHPHLKRTLDPLRIKIWGAKKKNSSFEEANFTNTEIVEAIKRQNKSNKITVKQVRDVRKNTSRKKGLIEAIVGRYGLKIRKEKLPEVLVDILIKKRTKRGGKRKTELEKIVCEIGQLVMFNHQPKGRDHQVQNFRTGFMG